MVRVLNSPSIIVLLVRTEYGYRSQPAYGGKAGLPEAKGYQGVRMRR